MLATLQQQLLLAAGAAPQQLQLLARRRCSSLRLRPRFLPPPHEQLNYFPGHMRTALHKLQSRLRRVDVVIEVHDARVPLSGRNVRFSRDLVATRAHLLVLNKADLVSAATHERIADQLRRQGDRQVLFTCCLRQDDAGVRSVVSQLSRLAHERRVALNEASTTAGSYSAPAFSAMCRHTCMVVGVPNVGKSSLINALRALHLRRARATPVGAVAGITRSVLHEIKVCERPAVYVLDTPGVLMPQPGGAEAQLRLALCAALQDHLVGPELLADYLLYWLNRRRLHQYVPYMGLQQPTDDIDHLLWHGARALNLSCRRYDVTRGAARSGFPDVQAAAIHMIRGFRSGAFGQLMLDDDLLTVQPP